MSRIGRLPIPVPTGVEVTIAGPDVTVKGPKGTLALSVADPIKIERDDDGVLTVVRPNDERESRSLHGLTRTLVSNMVVGVTQGYEKKMEISGVGYRVVAKGSDLEFALGYSHPVLVHGSRRHHVHGRGADAVLRVGHRQAEGRPGGRQHPQAAQAGPVQGQGRALRGRGCPPQGRKGGQVVMAVSVKVGKGVARKGVARKRRHIRVRKKVFGGTGRPRLVVTRSSRHMVAQVVDDVARVTLASASTMDPRDPRAHPRQDGEGQAGRRASRRAGEGRRHRVRRVRPWRQSLPRACRRARRCGP